MMRLAWRDIIRNWKSSLTAVLLFAIPITLLTAVFSLAFTAMRYEEHPENTLTYVRTHEDLGAGFLPAVRGQVLLSHNGVEARNWITALDPAAGTADLQVPPAGTIDLPLRTARALGVEEGDTVVVADRLLTVNRLHLFSNSIAHHADFATGLETAQPGKWWVAQGEVPATYIELDSRQHLPGKASRIVVAFFQDPAGIAIMLSLLSLIIIFTAGLTAPLFAVAHKRMSHTVELLEQVGARRSQIRSMFGYHGLFLGIGGCLIGLPLSWLLAEASMRFLMDVSVIWDYALGLMFAAVTITSALIASMIPLIVRPQARPRLWHAIPGPVLLVIGGLLFREPQIGFYVALPLFILGGALSGFTVVALAPALAKRSPAVLRMALRDAHRNYLRSASAIGAIILAAVALTAFSQLAHRMMPDSSPFNSGTLARAQQVVNSPVGYEPQLRDLEKDFGPRTDLYTFADTSGDSYDGHLAWYKLGIYNYEIIAEPEFLDYLSIDDEVRERAKAKLDSGTPITEADLHLSTPGKLTTPTMAADKPLEYQASLFAAEPAPLKQLALHRQSQLSGLEIGPTSESASIGLVMGILLALGIIFVACITGLVLTLTQQESHTDRARLQHIGASPRTLRSYRWAQACCIAVPGLALGILFGLFF
ncbi:hypothetical protein CKALI_00830 [Corynebacterium kalinowskii]|uniref:ABC transporter permease n=2 Tax=Corynebacterium kalinowskii TaxID=2675216 RepID=A0A6B8VNF7_9CORY|nr:hypothetical protein CKALI_00830 [Corynebacterium kalinowskii]